MHNAPMHPFKLLGRSLTHCTSNSSMASDMKLTWDQDRDHAAETPARSGSLPQASAAERLPVV